jgi:DNA-binding MarR family transcriptional regulator
MNQELIEKISRSLNLIKGKCRLKDKHIAESLDISCSELNCLKHFMCRERLSVKDLAERLNITSGGVTKVVGSLEEQGILRRDMDPDDRRGIIVSLTPEGNSLLEKLKANSAAYYSEILEGLNAKEIEIVSKGLELLDGAWNKTAGETGGENC